MFGPTWPPGLAKSMRWWRLSTVNTLLAGLHHALFHAPHEHVAGALDPEDAGGRPARWRAGRPLWRAARDVEPIVDGVHKDGALAAFGLAALDAKHVVVLLQQAVAPSNQR